MAYRLTQTMPVGMLPGGASANCVETAPAGTSEAQAVDYFESTRQVLAEQRVSGGWLRLEEVDGAGSAVRLLREAAY